uniref:SHR-BD domain-containing protein n=1 Tax=Gongylonema pulchrum TaxID=637853 RepID=A0A183EDE0_9BILA
LVWNENFGDNRMLCVKRDDVKYWSCPFRIDLISSFHVTMRDADETPRFLRVEVILNSAIFYITFTDARYYPPPIQLENLSDVPVLYQQKIDSIYEISSRYLGLSSSHLRTICKARSTVDYAWDDPYGNKLLVLQVFENKSNCYDPQKPGMGPPLVYTNDLDEGFDGVEGCISQLKDKDLNLRRGKPITALFSHLLPRKPGYGFTDEFELALEVMQKGKVMLNKLNLSDSSRSQLWRFASDGCLENIGMNNRARPGERYVLDVLDSGGFERQLRCKIEGMFVEARKTEVVLAAPNKNSPRSRNGVPVEQVWELQSQRPGSGILDVECLYRGPTLVVRITDRAKPYRAVQRFHQAPELLLACAAAAADGPGCSKVCDFEVNVSMRNGIGLSFINGLHEELIYARFQGIVLHVNRQGRTHQITGSVEVIQADNQLLATDRWQVLFCQQGAVSSGESGHSDTQVVVPALKLEMNCTPMEHYDAFDVRFFCCLGQCYTFAASAAENIY